MSRDRKDTSAASTQADVRADLDSARLPAAFDGLARLAASSCRAPLASVTLIGWGRSCSGFDALNWPGTPPDQDPFFLHTSRASAVLEVPDARADGRFAAADCVSGNLGVRWYAGCALRSAGGDLLGTVAVYDTRSRSLAPEEYDSLLLLAEQCAAQAELRVRVSELEFVAAAEPAAAVHISDAMLMRTLVETAPVAIYHADSTGNLTYSNPEYRRMFELAPGQAQGDWILGVNAGDRERMQASWADFSQKPRPMRFEYRLRMRAGDTRHLAELIVPSADGRGFVGTISDFTDLVALRGDLVEAETLFSNTFDQAPIGIAYADPQGKILRCNQAYCAALGFAPAEMAGLSLADRTYPEDAAAAALEHERLWKDEIAVSEVEKRYLRKDGTPLWVRSSSARVRDGGSTRRSVEYLQDITERRAMESTLLQHKSLLEAVISEVPVSLMVADTLGDIVRYNRAAAELFSMPALHPDGGADRMPLDPYPLGAHVCLADGVTPVPRQARPLARALRGETVSNLELVIVPHHAGPERTALASARRLAGPDGQTLGAVAVTQDTTDGKRRELELERVHKELVTASRRAGMAEVATNVLHNVGNILNSVNVSASLVEERIKQSKISGIARLAELLKEQGERVGHFVSADERGKRVPEYLAVLGEQLKSDQRMALRELADLQENLEHIKDTVAMQQSYAKLCGITETVAVADLVEDSLRLNAGAFARHGVTLKREFAPVPHITVDKHKVLQILVNLIRNAKYACDESGRSDKEITLHIAEGGRGVRISVEDNGAGITAENMGRLFHHGFTTRKSGHGFGLHSGALAAQELGGSLHAESAGAGQGATFILDLPLIPEMAK